MVGSDDDDTLLLLFIIAGEHMMMRPRSSSSIAPLQMAAAHTATLHHVRRRLFGLLLGDRVLLDIFLHFTIFSTPFT